MTDLEHFDTDLGSWTAATAGDGTVTVVDSTALMEVFGAVNSGAGIYRAFAHAQRHLQPVCVRNAQDNPSCSLRVFHKSTPPICDTNTNLTAIEVFGIDFVTISTRRPRVYYFDSGGTKQHWDDATQAWTTSAAVASTPSGQNDSAVEIGYQFDLPNARIRFFVKGFGSGTSQIEACGPKLCCLTDWVALSAMRNGTSSTLWTTLGKFGITANNTGSCVVEWTQVESGPKLYVGTNQATVGASNYDTKLWESYGGVYWLPSGASPQRTATITTAGLQAWCTVAQQFGAGFTDDDGEMYFFFTGRAASGGSQIGMTQSSDEGVTWTPFASNPIIAAAAGTNTDNWQRVSARLDDREPDANKRGKLLVTALGADSVYRAYLYTSPHPFTTWTQQGVLIGPDGDSATGYSKLHMNPVFYDEEWVLMDGDWMWKGATLEIGAFTKSARVLGLELQNISQVASALSSTSRFVDVPDSTGFDAEAMILIDDDTSPGTWAINRVRRIDDATTFEMYERTPGYAAGALINRWDAGNMSLHHVRFDAAAGEWLWYVTMFKITTTYNDGGAIGANNLQISGLLKSSDLYSAPSVAWFHTPQTPLARENNTGTSENLKFFDPPVTADVADPDWFLYSINRNRRRVHSHR